MKRLVLLLCAGIIVSTSVSSCKKSYTCECVNINGQVSTRSVVATNNTEAQKNCDEYGLPGHCEIK